MLGRDSVRARCEELGPTRIREILASGFTDDRIFTGSLGISLNSNLAIAEAWLKEYEEKQNQFNIGEQIKISKKSNKIALEANKKAHFANWISLVALFFTFLNFILLLFIR